MKKDISFLLGKKRLTKKQREFLDSVDFAPENEIIESFNFCKVLNYIEKNIGELEIIKLCQIKLLNKKIAIGGEEFKIFGVKNKNLHLYSWNNSLLIVPDKITKNQKFKLLTNYDDIQYTEYGWFCAIDPLKYSQYDIGSILYENFQKIQTKDRKIKIGQDPDNWIIYESDILPCKNINNNKIIGFYLSNGNGFFSAITYKSQDNCYLIVGRKLSKILLKLAIYCKIEI